MSGPSAPSPIGAPQRANSTGPNGPLPSPGVPLVNGITGTAGPSNAVGGGGGGPAGSGQPPMSQQNLNQIVSNAFDFLHLQTVFCASKSDERERKEEHSGLGSHFFLGADSHICRYG